MEEIKKQIEDILYDSCGMEDLNYLNKMATEQILQLISDNYEPKKGYTTLNGEALDILDETFNQSIKSEPTRLRQ